METDVKADHTECLCKLIFASRSTAWLNYLFCVIIEQMIYDNDMGEIFLE